LQGLQEYTTAELHEPAGTASGFLSLWIRTEFGDQQLSFRERGCSPFAITLPSGAAQRFFLLCHSKHIRLIKL
jgi:hypothetical protein